MARKREGTVWRWLNEKVAYGLEKVSPKRISKSIAESRKRGWQKFYDGVRGRNAVAHVNDCADDDSRLRLTARSSEMLGRYAGFSDVSSDIEGSAGIITALDALTGTGDPKSANHDRVVLANIAPREGEGKKHENGSPFCYFWDKTSGALVVSTADGKALSLVKKFGLADEYFLLDTRKTLQVLRASGMISDDEQARIGETQFRSFEFSPRVAAYLLRYGHIEGATKKKMKDVPDAPEVVYHVDRFAKYGNCKTTLLPEDKFSPDIVKILKSDAKGEFTRKQVTTLATRFGVLPVYRRLKDVPQDGKPAVIVGSSGLGENRFLEIVVQGGNAGEVLKVKPGDSIF